MHISPDEFITTKEAAKLSGYSSDYLARLARSNNIVGRQVGRAWLIDLTSLEEYLTTQGLRKNARAQELARVRADEYRVRQIPPVGIPEPFSPSILKRTFQPTSDLLASRTISLIVACAVVAGGALTARADFIPTLASHVLSLGEDTLSGLDEILTDTSKSIARRIDAERDAVEVAQSRVSSELAYTTSHIALAPLASPDLSFMSRVARLDESGRTPTPHPLTAPSTKEAHADIMQAVRATALLAMHPSRLVGVLTGAHRLLGIQAYALIQGSFANYRTLIDIAGAQVLVRGANSRDVIAGAPMVLVRADAALGTLLVRSAHRAVALDTSLVYTLSSVGPRSARLATGLIMDTGASTLRLALYAPRGADVLASQYLALVQGMGNLAYTTATTLHTDLLALASFLPSLPTNLPATLEDRTLALMGQSAHLLDSLPTSNLATALSAGQQTALTTYRTIHGWFSSANETLATLLAPYPTVVLPELPPHTASAPPATTPAVVYRTPVYTSPTYSNVTNSTTIVKGVSADLLTQSLVALRSDLMNQFAVLVQPMNNQIATNITTIQQVNMIQDLANLIVRNGDFRGGTFNNGRVTNGISVSATDGSFTNLTGGTTTLATTTVTGNLTVSGDTTVSGTLTAGALSVASVASAGAISAPYFSATSTSATSTFAGALAIGTTTPWGNGLFTLGTSSPLIFVDRASGNIGMRTSTPAYGLELAGTARFTGLLDADHFVATSTSNYSIFNGGFLSNASSTLQAFTYTSATGTSATTTNSFATTASSTNLFSALASFGSLTLGSALTAANGGMGTTTWQTNSIPYFNGTNFTEHTGLAYNGTKLTATYASSTALSVSGTGYFGTASSTNLTVSSLTSTRIPFATTNGAVTDSSLLTFASGAGVLTTPYASTTALSAGATSYSTLLGDYATSSIRGALALYGNTTSGAPSSLTLQRGSTSGNTTILFNDQTGANLLALGTSANSGHAALTGYQSYLDLGTSSGGTALSIDTSGNVNVTSHLLPTLNQQYNIGSAALYWNHAYINDVVANNISSASTSIAGTNTTSFSIYSNNPTIDTQDISLIFYRGAGAPANGVLSWNATQKRFDFNQNLRVTNASASTASTTLQLAAVASQTGPLTSWLDSSENVLSTILSNGYLGIGTSTPAWGLTVASSTGPQVALTGTGTNIWTMREAGGNLYFATSSPTTFATSSQTRLTLASNGFIGIGTTTPSAPLVLESFDIGSGKGSLLIEGNFNTERVELRSAGATPGPAFQGRGYGGTIMSPTATQSGMDIFILGGSGFDGTNIVTSNSSIIKMTASENWTSTANGSYIHLDTTPNGLTTTSRAERLRITDTGLIGIGTTTPFWNLTVASSTGPQLALVDTTSSSNAWTLRSISNSFYIATSTALATSTYTALTINPNGLVGIGTTSPAAMLAVAGSGYLAGTLTLLPTAGALQKGINSTQSASGVPTQDTPLDAGWNFNQIKVSDTGVDASGFAAGSQTVNGLNVAYTSSGAKGIGQAIMATINVTGSPAQTSNTLNQFVAGQFIGQASANMGGTSGTPVGAIFGLGATPVAASGATFLLNVSNELNIQVHSGASTKSKSILSLAGGGTTDAVQGSTYDTELSLSNIAGSVGFQNGILFSDYNGQHPVTSTGTLIATQGSYTTLNGIDLSSYTFTGNAFKSNNFLLDGSGRVAVGTTTPFWNLTVASSTGPQLALVDTTTSSNAWTLRSISNSFYLATSTALATSTYTALTINPNGLVGIGNAAPRSLLDVLSGTANTTGDTVSTALITGAYASPLAGTGNLFIQTNDDFAIDKGGSIAFGGRHTTSNTAGAFFAGIKGAKENSTNASLGGYLAFYTRGADSPWTVSEAMRITSAGLVGIGTTSPSSLLEVGNSSAGSILMNITNSNTGVSAYAELNLRNDYGVETGLRLLAMGTGNTVGGIFTQDAGVITTDTALSGGLNIGTRGSVPMRFYAGDGEKARIDSSGNFLMATTTAPAFGANTFVQTNGVMFLDSTTQNTGLVMTGANGAYFSVQSSDAATGVGTVPLVFNATGGNVYIATTSPFAGNTAKLSIDQTTAGARGLAIMMPTAAETTAAGLRVMGYSPSIELVDKDNVQNWYMAIDDNESNVLSFGRGYGPGQGITSALNITTSDNIGIGTTTPTGKLVIYGNGTRIAPTYQGDIQILGMSGGGQTLDANGGLEFNPALSYGNRIVSPDLGSNNTPLVFQYRNASATWSEALRISNTPSAPGYLGIGTTTPSNALTVANATLPQLALVDTTASSNAWTLRSISNSFYLATSTYSATSTTAALTINPNGAATFGNNLTVNGTSAFTGLLTLTNGFVSQASSTVVGDFTNTGFMNTSGTGGGYQIDGKLILTASSTLSNLSLGFSAGAATTTTGTANVAVGLSALAALTSGTNNTALGYQAGRSITSQTGTTFLGYQAGLTVTSNNVTCVGSGACGSLTGKQNVALGTNALSGGGAGEQNVGIGFQVGTGLTTGSKNVFIGVSTASSTASGSNNIAIGYDILLPSTNGSNQLNIGNLIFGTGIDGQGTTLSSGNVGIGTTSPTTLFSITGGGGTYVDSSGNLGLGRVPASVFDQGGAGSAQLTLARNDSLTTFGGGQPQLAIVNTNGATSTSAHILFAKPTQGGNIEGNAAIIADFVASNAFGASMDAGANVYPATDLVFATGGSGGTINQAGVERLRITSYGHVVPGADNTETLGSSSLHWDCVYYDATVTGTCASDSRLKGNIADFSLGADPLGQLAGLRPRTFTYNDNPAQTTNYGFVAQEVLTVAPEMVATGADGFYEVKYGYLPYLTLAAVQQLNTKVDANASTTAPLVSAFSITPAGLVGIGTNTPTHTLEVVGDVGATGFVNTSTRAAKSDIQYLSADQAAHTLDKLQALKPATYRYTSDSTNQLRLGLIAEDAQGTAPEVLSADGKGIDLYKLATFTLQGTQALASKVSAQEIRLTALEERVAALESGAVAMGSGGGGAGFSTSTLTSTLQSLGILVEKGIAQFDTLVARRFVALAGADGSASAGSATILASNTVAEVTNSLVAPSTKIFITFNTQVVGPWWVSDKADGSFRVALSAPQTADVSFDYFLVQTEGAIQSSTSPASSGQSSGTPITLAGDNPVHLSVGGTYTEPGVMVASGHPLTTYINGEEREVSAATIDTSVPTTYIITYSSTDSAGNMVSALRSVIVGNPDGTVSSGGDTTPPADSGTGASGSSDTTPPVVTLLGEAASEIAQDAAWADPGATAADDVDGDITASITESGAVDTATPGLYTLTYSATDAAGNTGSASRVVMVAAP